MKSHQIKTDKFHTGFFFENGYACEKDKFMQLCIKAILKAYKKRDFVELEKFFDEFPYLINLNFMEIAKFYLRNESPLGYSNDTFLSTACKYKDTEMMRFFIRKGANHALSDHIIKNIEYNERENMLKLLETFDSYQPDKHFHILNYLFNMNVMKEICTFA
jgi:hypothetical protein